VRDILSKRSDLSEDQILGLIDEKKKEGRGLLSDEGAARLVAEELLIQTQGTKLGRMQVKELVSGLNDVSISGRVLLAWPPQQFQRKDGTPGRVMRLALVDRSGRVRFAVWDRHVEILSKAGKLQGKILRVGHAYTRQGLAGDTELHAGDRASIEIDPQDLPDADFPEFRELFTPISKLEPGTYQLNVIGIVQSEPRHYTFQKEDRAGSVLRTVIADESGSIPVVAWNERAEELRNVKTGAILQVLNARTKLDTNARPELHVESRSQLEILSAPPDYLKVPEAKTYTIASLTGQLGTVDLLAYVLAKGPLQEVKRTNGETTKVARLIIGDETGIASLSLWDDKAELVNQLDEGESVELRGLSIRERLGEINLSLGKSGRLQKSPKKFEARELTKLASIQSARGLLIIEGVVSDQPLARQVVTERGETVSLASFTIRDDTGSAKVTVWRDQVEQVTKLRPRLRVRVTGLRVRPGLAGELELTSVPATKIEEMDQPENERPAWEDIRHVIALEPGLVTWVKGVILGAMGETKLRLICETCSLPLKVSEKDFTCANCKSTKTGNVRFSGRLKIDDGTGVAEVIASDLDPTPFLSTNSAETRERMIKEERFELMLDNEESQKIIGKEIEVYGTAQQPGLQSKFEVKATKILAVSKL
jgi:ssDNA-binding replication factor A large subunit